MRSNGRENLFRAPADAGLGSRLKIKSPGFHARNQGHLGAVGRSNADLPSSSVAAFPTHSSLYFVSRMSALRFLWNELVKKAGGTGPYCLLTDDHAAPATRSPKFAWDASLWRWLWLAAGAQYTSRLNTTGAG
jgi:hypothetical protein